MDSCLPFLHIIERLKNTPRAGWVKRGVEGPESVSDHMWRMAIICLLLPKVRCLILFDLILCYDMDGNAYARLGQQLRSEQMHSHGSDP